ncbi:hypothetical protein [Mesorhizobium sp.]|uniref:hypothetical protein n=1 Tax=Mesorhizobium sp. TaxID=1871066 RepID=UPI0026C90CCF
MLNKISRTRLNRLVIGVAVAAMTFGTAFAQDNSTPLQNGTLPGVSNDYRIAEPAPEPDDAVPSNGNGQFKIGETDVRISGSIAATTSRHSCPCGPKTNSPAAASANGRGFLGSKIQLAGSALPAFDFGCFAAFSRRSD